MIGTFEITAMKGTKRIVKYYTVVLKDGIADKLYQLQKCNGCHDITVRLM